MIGSQGDEQLLELARERAAVLKRWDAPGPDLSEDQVDHFTEEVNQLDAQIAETPADSLSGLAVKARILARDLREGAGGNVEDLAESLLQDLVRLAGVK